LRAYYFGMAVMSWMVSASLFIFSTMVIVIVLARREFSSPVLNALTTFRSGDAGRRPTDTD